MNSWTRNKTVERERIYMNQVGMMSKRKSQMENLQMKLASVENAIQQVNAIKNSLEEKADTVKSEIRRNFSSQAEKLRCREEQLIRQVEVLASTQSSLLQRQFAKLYHSLGWLQSTLNSAEDGQDFESPPFPTKDLECVKRMTMQSLPSFSLSMDESGLNSAVQEFGRIEVLGTLLSFTSPEASSCLPSQVEEYEEERENYLVMHKTLQGVDFARKICIPSTHTLDMKEWLVMKEKNVDHSRSLGNKFNKFMDHEGDSKFNWLHKTKEIKEDDDDFQMVDHLQDGLSYSPSDSIEVISNFSSKSPSEAMFSIINLPNEEWLSKKKEKLSDCCCDNKNVEIENLSCLDCCTHDQLSKKNDYWLAKNSPAETTTILSNLTNNVSKICIANEPCESFLDCICDENCAIQWLHKPETNEERKEAAVEKTSKLLEPMLKILYGKNQDYLTGREDKNGNLAEGGLTYADKEWLHPKSFSCDNSMWLC